MGNLKLFLSALFFGVIHVIWIYRYWPCRNNTLIILYLAGVITSLLNHGLTSKLATILDRLVMSFGLFVDLHASINIPSAQTQSKISYLSRPTFCIVGIFLAASMYFITKLLIKEGFFATSTGKGRPTPSNPFQENIRYIPHFSAHACLTFVHCCLLEFYKV